MELYMPIYEFTCKKCGTDFSELFHSSTFDASEVECPKCRAHEANRKLSVFAADCKSSGESMPMMGGGCGAGCGCHMN
ncbi:MAG TPA: zinc ribbon domain-containing protein [bacterium]|nr:zinc ribbon domain-containing protein [bacterium]